MSHEITFQKQGVGIQNRERPIEVVRSNVMTVLWEYPEKKFRGTSAVPRAAKD
jgi:hypothetical protein